MRYKRYTPEEDELIRKAINNSPENITEALRKLSLETGREWTSMSGRWYSHISRQENNRTSPLFMILSPRKRIQGRKNITDKNREFLSTNRGTIWNRILRLFQ